MNSIYQSFYQKNVKKKHAYAHTHTNAKSSDKTWLNDVECLNCNNKGHTFRYCKYPINSYGILAYKNDTDKPPGLENLNSEIKYLFIQRKDTIGFIDFVRGKYKREERDESIKLLVEEMTENEKTKLINMSFNDIWNDMWLNKKSSMFLNEKTKAEDKFKKLDIKKIITGSCPSGVSDTDFGIPKGRKMKNETFLACAIREFQEETGYTKNEINVLDIPPLVETFYGTNTVAYRHVYFIAEILTTREPVINKNNILQIGEIKNIKWFTFKECINILQSFHHTKRTIMYQARDLIEKYTKQLN